MISFWVAVISFLRATSHTMVPNKNVVIFSPKSLMPTFLRVEEKQFSSEKTKQVVCMEKMGMGVL